MKHLMRIGTVLCLVVQGGVASANNLILDFEPINCQSAHHRPLECQENFNIIDPQMVRKVYWDLAYTVGAPDTAYDFARYFYTTKQASDLSETDKEGLVDVVRTSADQGYAPAQVTYAAYLQSSQVGDASRALNYFLEAHMQGNLKGTFEAAKIYYGWGWYQKSFDLMKTAAHAGESEAQYLTGLMLSQGLKDEAGGFWSQLGSLVGAGKTARMRADRPEAIHWLLRALKQKHPLAKDALLVLFENNVREGSATYAELMMLADGCDISKTSLYDSRNRWDAIDYYQKAARLAAQAHDFGREGEARYQAGVILNKPYLEGDKAHFQWKRMRDVAREHFSVAASLGHERAQLCLEALDIEQCLDAHLAVNAAAISVQQMCGFFPGDWNPMQAVGALPCVPTEPQTALM